MNLMGDEVLKGGAIIDSSLTLAQALALRQEIDPPAEVLAKMALIDVEYYSFDAQLHRGQVVLDKDLAEDVRGAFSLIKETKFPVSSVIPAQNMRFMNDIEKVAAMNNSVGFSYRKIAQRDELSNHSFGRAFDINPFQNPYTKEGYHFPPDATHNPSSPGTFTLGSPVVAYFKSRGWQWGGDWPDRKDYMHFDKLVS